ncbi:MAG: hypothetical protein BAJATHORv1_60107 [Candidatus Thorarchaeota archaeon]|nr:MAG: hypothetical protein BAJATHORv1_60107 [Candidatus Thorarchaeota archaeon]
MIVEDISEDGSINTGIETNTKRIRIEKITNIFWKVLSDKALTKLMHQ